MFVPTQMIHMQVKEVSVNISDIVLEISGRIKLLEPRRQYLFLEWLSAHCSRMQNGNITEGLNTWLGDMHQGALVYEHNLIVKEIDWWTAQSEATVERLMREHFVGRRS